jgi:hypothetical protein
MPATAFVSDDLSGVEVGVPTGVQLFDTPPQLPPQVGFVLGSELLLSLERDLKSRGTTFCKRKLYPSVSICVHLWRNLPPASRGLNGNAVGVDFFGRDFDRQRAAGGLQGLQGRLVGFAEGGRFQRAGEGESGALRAIQRIE